MIGWSAFRGGFRLVEMQIGAAGNGEESSDLNTGERPELVNIAKSLEDDELKKIAEACYENFRIDEESRSEWMVMHASWIDQFYQREKQVNPPWPGASEESLPILTEACNQFNARTYKAFFPNRKALY